MKQKILDTLARLDYSEEKFQIKRIKRFINNTDYPVDSSRKYAHLNTLKFYKERLEYAKRRVPMKAVLNDDCLDSMYICPTCRWAVRFLRPYCSECGQRIMW